MLITLHAVFPSGLNSFFLSGFRFYSLRPRTGQYIEICHPLALFTTLSFVVGLIIAPRLKLGRMTGQTSTAQADVTKTRLG
jgi:hypothetical protein